MHESLSPRRLVTRLVADDAGQDLVEYALLLAFTVTLGLALAWTGIAAGVGTSFGGTSTGVQGLWEPPPPSGS